MFSGWRKKRVVDHRPGFGGWGPPHPPPEPLIPTTPVTTPVAAPRGPAERRRTRGSGHPAAATVRLIAAAAAGALVLVTLALLSTGLPSSPGRHTHRLAHAAPTSTTAPRTGVARGRTTLTAVNAIVDETGAGRERVISAIDAVGGCSMAPSDGEAAIGQAITVREQGLSDLQRLSHAPVATPPDRSLIQSLTAVINDSVQADTAYMAWMADIASGKTNCSGSPTGDANFVAGQTFSAKADNDKQVFVQAWNPIAGQDGLSTYQAQDF